MSALPSSNFNGVDGKTLVLQAADLVAIISQTVKLTKRGTSYVGLCPFHSEKSPSFHVHPDRGYFYCFGCKENGNAIDFVMKRDRLPFIDAMRSLADQYHVELPKGGSSKEGAGLRQSLLDACSAAAAFFEQNLQNPKLGGPAREYLAKRGFNDETIKQFRIGLAPDGWDNLASSPLMKKFRPELLNQAGLLKPGEKRPGFYDTFRHRLMFPIRDEAGRVIAFGGRVMPGNTSPAKYLNSPETPLFSKSKVAYGLDLGRQKIVETKTVAVVEGYTDVVMAHQYGASNVISVLGTALTESHVNLLRRFAGRIVLLFDGDAAGDMAVQRALELFLTQPIEIGIATLPDGVDPDEFLLQNGVEAFDKMLATAEDALSFQWKQLFRELSANEGDLTARSKAVEAYLERLSAARGSGPVDPLRWGAILARVSKVTDISAEDLNRRFRVTKPAFQRPAQSPQQNSAPEVKISSPPRQVIPANRQTAERWILGGLLHRPAAWQEVQQTIAVSDFMTDSLRPLAEWYWDHQRNEGEPDLAEVIRLLDSGPLKTLAIELASEADGMNNQQTLAEAAGFIRQEKQRQAHTKLLGELRRSKTERLSDDSEVDLLRKFQEAAGIRSIDRA